MRPSSKVYGFVLPQPVKSGVANFATNLDLPGDMVNGALQGNGSGHVPDGSGAKGNRVSTP